MRPVNRGNPASYPQNYMTSLNAKPKVVTAVNRWQTAVDTKVTLQTNIDTIEQAVKAKGGSLLNNGKKRKGGTGESNLGIKKILKARPALVTAYNDALNALPFVQTNLENTAKDLIENLKQEQSYRDTRIKFYAKKVAGAYPASRSDLITNLGQYCSYCEMPLATSLAVEHMLPKAGFPVKSVSWDNFLLACPLCNSLKNDKPSRNTGVEQAIRSGHNPPTNIQIQAGAWGTYLWPSDATDYTNWQTFYKYQMKKVVYDNNGTRVSSEDIPDDVVRDWGFGATKATIVDDTGYAIELQFVRYLANVQWDYNAVLADLQSGTVHQTLLDAINLLPEQFRLNSADNIVVAATQPNVWQLQQTQNYIINTVNQQKPTLSIVNGPQIGVFTLGAKTSRAFLADLRRGVLPDLVKDILKTSPYLVYPLNQQVTVTQPDRSTFRITVVKKLYIIDDNELLKIYSAQQYQVEAHVTAIGSPAQARAAQVIEDTKLNRVIMNDPKVSDRRMIKRTRTWFIALDAVRSLNQIVGTSGFRAPGQDLEQLIIQTAIATGYWSVWWSVLNTFLSLTYRNALTQFLLNAANFPGTR